MVEEFDEVGLLQTFIKDIKEIFDNQYERIGNEVYVADSEDVEPTFPCCIVNILNPISQSKYDSSDGSFQFIDFSLNCELYTKKINDLSLRSSGTLLSQILIAGIVNKYGAFKVSRNTEAPYRVDTNRHIVTFNCVYDNVQKIIYSY